MDIHQPASQRRRDGWHLTLLFAAIGLGSVAYGARRWLAPLASRHGAGIDAMLHYLLITVGALFLVACLTLAYFIWRGSRRDQIGSRLATRRTSGSFRPASALAWPSSQKAASRPLAFRSGVNTSTPYHPTTRSASRSPRSSSCGTCVTPVRMDVSDAPTRNSLTIR